MNRLSTEKRILILKCLVNGTGARGAARIANVTKNTVLRLMVNAGRAAGRFQNEKLRNLPCRHIQVDELWSFLFTKQKNLRTAKNPPPGAGDLWTWTAICADTRLAVSWRVGDRSEDMAYRLFRDVRGRLQHTPQITTDGFDAYFRTVRRAFGWDVDYGAVLKAAKGEQPAIYVTGEPDPSYLHTSYVERHNLTLRSSMRRYTRRTIGYSRKLSNHRAMLALWMYAYNFVQPHRSLQQVPAVAAEVAEQPLGMAQIVELVDVEYERTRLRGPYRKRVA